MPMTMERAVSPKGHATLKVHSSGDVTLDEARLFARETGKGGAYAGLPLFAVTGVEVKMSTEVRKVFMSGQGDLPVSAIVMPNSNVVTRGLINFMIKAAPRLAEGAAPARIFATEAEGWAYIDETMEARRR